MDDTTALVVFTYKSKTRILANGGTDSWSLNPRSMNLVSYVVCTRNADRAKAHDAGGPTGEEHGEAFLIGHVSGIEKLGMRNGRARYRVLMDSYAEISLPDFWDGSRSPTRYVLLRNLIQRGLDMTKIKFVRLDRSDQAQHPRQDTKGDIDITTGLTIAQAKRGLAARFGVSESDIEIVIKG